VAGKLIRKSLKTDVLTVAKLRLGDLDKQERQRAECADAAGCRGSLEDELCLDEIQGWTIQEAWSRVFALPWG
jgi:hypothetical protein